MNIPQLAALAGAAVTTSLAAQPIVLPGVYASTSGQVLPSDTLTREFPRTHQQVIAASQLVTVPAGSRLTQITFRASNFGMANALGPWPPVDITFADFEVYLGRAAAPAGSMYTTFAENVVPGSEARVRDGALFIPAGSFSNYVAPPGANPWGLDIALAPYTYQGGDLVITVRHSGHQFPQVPRLYIDSIANPVPALVECMAATSMTATSGSPGQSLPAIVRLRYVTPAACYVNCDGSTGTPLLTANDFLCFLNSFSSARFGSQSQQAASYANCDGSTNFPVLNIGDFVCFNSRFAAGCS